MTGAGSPPPAAGKGLVEAAHFCYLVAHVPFGHYTVKTDHLALLGSSHRYVVFWGWEWEGCFPGDWFSPCWVSRFPFSCVNSATASPLFWVFSMQGSGQGGAQWVLHHTSRGPQAPVLLPRTVLLCLWGVLCPSDHWVAPWLHDQRSPLLTCLSSQGGLPLCYAALGLSQSRPWAELEIGGSLCLLLTPLHWLGAQATPSPTCYLFFAGHHIGLFTQKDLNNPIGSK